MPSTAPPTISFAPSLEATFAPSLDATLAPSQEPSIAQSTEASAAPSVPDQPFPPANITSFLQTNSKKFSLDTGPLAGFVIGCVAFGALLTLLFYYCIMPSIGLTGVGKNTVAPLNQAEKNVLI